MSSNDDAIRQHLNNILSDANAAKALLDGTEPPPTEPPPPHTGYELITRGRTWLLEGTVPDWNNALVFPRMEGLAGFTRASIDMTLQVGPDFAGLHNLLYWTENAGKWKGDVVCLLNRGANGALALSHTLGGSETTPVRAAFPLVAGQTVELKLRLLNNQVTVQAAGATVSMPIPPLTSTSLVLQLGNSATDGLDHPTNTGWKLLALNGSVA